jgi:hypothetical protein
MVTLEFKQLILRTGIRFDYKQQLAALVRDVAPLDQQGVAKRGFSGADMDTAEALATKIEESNGQVELNAAEVMQLVGRIDRAEWPFSDKAFQQFMADIRGLADQ